MNLELISDPNQIDLENLTPEQEKYLENLRWQLHNYNLGKAELPSMSMDVRRLLSSYSERKMAKEVLGK